MAKRSEFAHHFEDLRKDFKAKTKRSFLTDIEGQIEEDDEIRGILRRPGKRNRFLEVTFDRRYKDGQFSYSYFDLILVTLDTLSGGSGIYKPSNQMRALRWNGSRSDLLKVLRYFGKNNPQVNFRRLLVLPFPTPPTGYRIDSAIHLK